MKPGARLLAVDDSPFTRGRDEKTFLVGLLFRGLILESAAKEEVTVDGDDAIEAICSLYEETGREARIILLHGTTFAGFNMVPLRELAERTGIPVAAFLERAPDIYEVISALEKAGLTRKALIMDRNPPYERFETERGPIFCSYVGVGREDVASLIDKYSVESRMPEQLRVAHIVAGLLGE